MGVYIKGMEMPEIGENQTIKAEIRNVNGKVAFGIMTGGYYCCEQWKYYPLVEVPPHGDLIERDKLRAKEFIHDGDAYAVVMSRDIRNAATIIPADEDGET